MEMTKLFSAVVNCLWHLRQLPLALLHLSAVPVVILRVSVEKSK